MTSNPVADPGSTRPPNPVIVEENQEDEIELKVPKPNNLKPIFIGVAESPIAFDDLEEEEEILIKKPRPNVLKPIVGSEAQQLYEETNMFEDKFQETQPEGETINDDNEILK